MTSQSPRWRSQTRWQTPRMPRAPCSASHRRPDGGARMIDTLTLSAEEASSLIERREVSAAELHASYLDAIAERDPELHCFLRVVEEPNATSVPIALKDVISTKGVET